MNDCDGCCSPVACAGANLCLRANERELEALRTLLAGQICGCQGNACPKVTDAVAAWIKSVFPSTSGDPK
jgi:hypothetical protein